jgi:hypothetical protein
MVFVSNALDEKKMFYDCCAKDFTVWHAFLLLLWSLSVFVWSLSMFTHKVCEMLQTLIIGCLQILKEIREINSKRTKI